jgi:hypothetical protein
LLTARRNHEFSRGAIGGDIATMSSSEDDSDDDYAGVAVGKGSESDDDDAIDASSDYCHQVVVRSICRRRPLLSRKLQQKMTLGS